MYVARTYREQIKGKNLQHFQVQLKETDLLISAQKKLEKKAIAAIKKYRAQLEKYIENDPRFLTALDPYHVKDDAPAIVSWMAKTAAAAGVGPMAAVAGAIAECVGRELLHYSDEIIIENGGDIFLYSKIPRKIGIFAGDSPFSNQIALKINELNTPLGICTSAGTVGPSLSFGKADAAVVIANDTALADAVATATGNRVKSAQDIAAALAFARNIKGVKGVLIIIGEHLGAWGEIELTKI